MLSIRMYTAVEGLSNKWIMTLQKTCLAAKAKINKNSATLLHSSAPEFLATPKARHHGEITIIVRQCCGGEGRGWLFFFLLPNFPHQLDSLNLCDIILPHTQTATLILLIIHSADNNTTALVHQLSHLQTSVHNPICLQVKWGWWWPQPDLQ